MNTSEMIRYPVRLDYVDSRAEALALITRAMDGELVPLGDCRTLSFDGSEFRIMGQ